jgi:ABC-type amino acid transport system permease subunit
VGAYAAAPVMPDVLPPVKPKKGFLGFLRRNPTIAVGGFLLLLMLFVAIFAPVLGTVDPTALAPAKRTREPSSMYWFGSDMLGLGLGPWISATLGLSLNAGAFLGEIWRGSIQSVPKSQSEAAMALGLHYLPRMRHIVLPQALRIATAPTVGFLVNLVKSTSLAAVIGFVELTRAGQVLNNVTFRPFTVFMSVAVLYFLLCWPLTIASRRLERRMAQATKR